MRALPVAGGGLPVRALHLNLTTMGMRETWPRSKLVRKDEQTVSIFGRICDAECAAIALVDKAMKDLDVS